MTLVDPTAVGSDRPTGRDRPDRSIQLDTPDPVVRGIAGNVAKRLGASPLVVRVAFVVLALAAGVGVALYVTLWIVGLDESASTKRRTLRHDLGVVTATAAALLVTFNLIPSVPPEILGPLAFVSFAMAFSTGPSIGADLRSGRAFGRIAVGLLLMLGGLVAGVAAIGDLGQIWVISAAIATVTVGVGVVLAPWIRELVDGASADRVERIRAEERADIAAHLHDSVLQTLTLIQNRAHEPHVASSLAYQQERELRRWLYRTTADDSTTAELGLGSLRAQLADLAVGVEDDYLVVVDVVGVGDAAVDSAIIALLGAVREALINAAKFAQTRHISLYTEADDQRVVAFVRDRGIGFIPEAVAADRRGIADSIHTRVERVGGTALVRSAPGAGTEVRIEVPR